MPYKPGCPNQTLSRKALVTGSLRKQCDNVIKCPNQTLSRKALVTY